MKRVFATSGLAILPLVAIVLLAARLAFATIPASVEPTLPLVAKSERPTTTVLPLVATVRPTPAPRFATVAATALRVRSCASVDCPAVAWLSRGDRVRVDGCDSGWAYLPHRRGWSRSIYLTPDYCKQD